ncbi:MAG: glutathione S-transferase family protein [Myxococcota bacterium]
MTKLFFNKYTRATRPRWLVEEAGLPVEIVPVDMVAGEHKRPEYLRLHPHGKLPVLVDGDTAIFESAAICMHLADRFPEAKMAPAPGTVERGLYYQWMVYAMATLEPPVYATFLENKKPEGERDAATLKKAREDLDACLKVLSDALAGRDWLLGELCAADVVVGSIVAWAAGMKLTGEFPVVEAYVARCKARPGFAKART